MSIECHLDHSTIYPFAKMLETLVDAGFNVGINSFGAWRDLIRQTPILPDHWGQYLVVAAWRGSLPTDDTYDQLLPYTGIQQLFTNVQLQTLQSQLQKLGAEHQHAYEQFQATLDELRVQQSQLHTKETELQAVQSQLHAKEVELHATQGQLHTTQAELHATQGQLHTTQIELQATQGMLGHYQSSRLIRLAEKLRSILRQYI